MPEAQQLGVQGLAVQQLAGGAVDLVAQEREAPFGELHADLVAPSSLQLDLHHGVARQALQDPIVGDRQAGALELRLGLGVIGDHAHAQRFALHQLVREGAGVFGQFAHQHGDVDAPQVVLLEDVLEPVQGLGGLGEHQHSGGVAVQTVGDEQVEPLEAAPPVVVGEGLGQAGVMVLLGRHGEQTRGLVHEHQVLVLPHQLEGHVGGTAGPGQGRVGHVRIEGHLHGVLRVQPQPVRGGHLAVDLDAVGVDEALGLAVAGE